jgi:mono/diheme cytochrome c family protein
MMICVVVAACSGGTNSKPVTQPLKLATGEEIPVSVLERGRIAYMSNCRQCHGDAGDGDGPAAYAYRPPPRDFTRTQFRMKFAAVQSALPNDADLHHVIRYGLNGTPMLPWDVQDAEIADIIAYLKTLSPSWSKSKPGEPVKIDADPWLGKETDAVAEGKRLYHTSEWGCTSCHPSYATKKDMFGWFNDPARLEVRTDSHFAAEPKDSDYRAYVTREDDLKRLLAEKNPLFIGVDANGRAIEQPWEPANAAKVVRHAIKLRITPPDFTMHPLRAIHDDPRDPNHAKNDIFRTIAAGIGGVAMPGFRRPTTDKAADEKNIREIWAVAHYIDSLRVKRGTSEAVAFKQGLNEDFTPPAPPPPPPTEGAPGGATPAPGGAAPAPTPAAGGAAPAPTPAAPAPAAPTPNK